ncbi:MAG: beta-lactamase family protein [Chitinophagaceae bacterium]|nr:beta-lactamase family protein [Chitinophagaceae bacterium]
MKRYSPLLLTVVIYVSCNSFSGKKQREDDSLQYYPPTPVNSNKAEFRRIYRDVHAFFDTTLLKSEFNGGILIAKDGNILYEKYSGKIDLRKRDSITSVTPMHIASTTKTFTGIAILRLVQEGKLSLNDSLNTFFPQLPYPGITVKMLLNHRSGLPNYLHFMSNAKWGIDTNGKWNREYATNNDVVKMLVEKKPEKTWPANKKFSYCNTNYILLALIIEKITGKSYPDYMRTKFFEPLQMNDSFVFTLKDTSTATPSFSNKGTYWNYDFLDATYGDKNIYTTPRDLLKWDQALYTDQIISTILRDSAFSGYSFEKPGIHNYGLGWRLQLLPNGKKVVYHFGRWHGFNAAFTRLVDEKATIIILGNKFTRSIYASAYHCYAFFGDYQQQKVTDEPETDSLPAGSKKKE